MGKARRRTVDETWLFLEETGGGCVRDAQGRPYIPPSMPNFDDVHLGFSFFRGLLDDEE